MSKRIAVMVTRSHVDWYDPEELRGILGVTGTPDQIAAWINAQQPATLRYREPIGMTETTTLTADTFDVAGD